MVTLEVKHFPDPFDQGQSEHPGDVTQRSKHGLRESGSHSG